MDLSVIIPAHNEERCIEGTLDAVDKALDRLRGRGMDAEVIVVDDSSTDSTAEIASRRGARVIRIERRQIAAARNAGAAAAGGRFLLFVDADTSVGPDAMEAALDHLESGRTSGGGARIVPDGPTRMIVRIIMHLWWITSKSFRLAAGAFIFARRDAFEEVGGFDERYFVAEEIFLSRALARWGRRHGMKFVILETPVPTSTRKAELYSGWEIILSFVRIWLRPFTTMRSRDRLPLWYDSRR